MKCAPATSTLRLVLLGLLMAASAVGCANPDPDPDPAVADGYLFGFTGNPDFDFVAVTSDSLVVALLEVQLALPEDERRMHINGPIGRGDGEHNLEWDWHFLPGQWALVEISIELCDGTPDFVNDNIAYFIDTVGRFCPWGAHVLKKLD